MAVAITGGQKYCVHNGVNYFSPLNLKSLAQWEPLFGKICILGTRVEVEAVPPGWVPIPENYEVRELYIFGRHRSERIRMVKARSKELFKTVSLFYARGPSHEAYYAYCVAKKMGVPLLFEMHGDWETSILSERSRNPVRVLTKGFRAANLKRYQKQMAADAVAVVSVGPAMIRKYVPDGTPSLVSTNHLVYEDEFIKRSNYNLNNPPRLLFVGVLNYYKGLTCLFKALDILNRQGREFELYIVGAGLLKPYLVNYTRKHNLESKIKFLGHVSFAEVMENYRTADLFVLPSFGGEGVPRVIQEAASYGCPVLASDVGSIGWQLKDGAGIVIPPGDEKNLAENIIHILEDEDLRRSLGHTGYKRALEFTLEKQAARIVIFIEEHIPAVIRGL